MFNKKCLLALVALAGLGAGCATQPSPDAATQAKNAPTGKSSAPITSLGQVQTKDQAAAAWRQRARRTSGGVSTQ